MPLVKTPVQVPFGPADQKTQSKFIALGKPSVAENVIQTKTRSYRKRGGFAPLSRTVDTGGITTGRDLVFDGSVPILRTQDTVYGRPGATWINRGAYKPVVPSQQPTMAGRSSHPLQVVTGTQTWAFAQHSDRTWYYSVVTDGLEQVATTQVSIVAYNWGRAVATTGAVWLFAGTPFLGGNSITAYKFSTTSPAAAPVVTVFANPGGVSVDQWDLLDAQSNGNGVVVAVGSSDAAGINFGGASRALFFGRLDTATGLVDGTGWVGDATITLGQFTTPCSFIRAGQSATTLHFVYRRSTNNHVMLSTVTAASLASATVDQGAAATIPGASAGVTGFRTAASGDISVVITDATTSIENATLKIAVSSGGVIGAAAVVARARLALSDPFFIGTTPYMFAVHDDAAYLQNAYYCLDLSATPGRIVSRTLYQLAGNAWQLGEASFANQWYHNWNCPVTVIGNVATLMAVMYVSNSWTQVKLSFDFAPATIGRPLAALDGQQVVFPGGWPSTLPGGAALADFTLPMYPRDSWTLTGPVTTSTLPQGAYVGNVCYAAVDRQGNVTRSAPSTAKALTISAANTVARFGGVPTLRTANSNVSVFVEFYLSAVDDTTLFLVKRVVNDPTVDVLPNVDISAPVPDGAEVLYTEGDALEFIAAPPHTWSASWRNRILLGGTDAPGAEVWPSFELSPGFGPAFNEILRFRVPDGYGKDTAGCPIDFNYFAVFKEDSVWLVSGAGPDPIGIGSYANTLQQVPDAPGCTNPRSVVQTPLGCMYQARNGEIWLVSAGGRAMRIGDGWDDHKAATVTAAVHSPHFELVLFFTDSAKALVFDYGNPLPGEAAGQQYVWNLPVAAVDAAVVRSSLYYIDSTGVVRTYDAAQAFDDTNTPILRRLKLPVTPSGPRGFQRVYRGQVVGEYQGAHSLKVTVDSFAGTAGETGSTSQSWTKAVAAEPALAEFRPDVQKMTALDVTIEDVGTDLTAAAYWDGLAFELGIKQGLPRLNTTQRM